jgi:hypothetical protein
MIEYDQLAAALSRHEPAGVLRRIGAVVAANQLVVVQASPQLIVFGRLP